ncbi:unnamed protein product [Rhizoctonia solani]|uniref:Yeast cell wall synthesis Kre9/Knh1-like N-terminal domain-containing protein n=1 Tax=Rhizoctonia solani TaxID=456999 RepID=A0A8H3CVH0_9AGAM|nr:unnamed protein product [Rhizoctonia solani]
MRATSVVALVAALAPAVLAGPYFTAPVSGTVCKGGEACTITWQDDGKAPDLATFGDCNVGLYTGNSQQQTMIQNLAVTNAQTAGTVQFIPDPAAGDNSKVYFIKMVSINTADPANAVYKATAYSAMFELTNMTGKFNETVQAQIAGTATSSTAAAAGASTTPAASSSGSASAHASSTSTARNSTSTGASANTNATTNGAGSLAVTGMGVFGAAALAALAAIF